MTDVNYDDDGFPTVQFGVKCSDDSIAKFIVECKGSGIIDVRASTTTPSESYRYVLRWDGTKWVELKPAAI